MLGYCRGTRHPPTATKAERRSQFVALRDPLLRHILPLSIEPGVGRPTRGVESAVESPRGANLPSREEDRHKPDFIWYWKRRLHQDRHGAFGGAYAHSSCGPDPCRRSLLGDDFAFDFGDGRGREDPVFGASGFGVRRPLRFLARRLDLSDEQLEDAARILERLEIERAQAAVDLRRTAADLADALDGNEFSTESAGGASQTRVDTARRVQEALTTALRELHEVLASDQRSQLATLIRRGELRI